MNVKLTMHLMPWEIDNALLTFTQLKKSYYHLPEDANVTIETVLNLSSKFVDWNESKLPKEFFIAKYDDLSLLLSDYNHIKRVYDGDEIYGFLNLQKESISEEVDYYVGVCPDMYFSEHLLALLIESTRVIKSEYFVVTPQIYKKWDNTWDEITDENYLSVPYSDWDKADVYKTIHEIESNQNEMSLVPVNKSKWAWWFDLYNKKFYEELCPVQSDWQGYGPWDWYSMMLSEKALNAGVNFQQYLLKGQTILDISTGFLKEMGFSSYYTKFLTLIPDYSPNVQRKIFESKMLEYLNYGIKQLELKNIIP
jgi:hypothetical protein